ncbi:hypothetical protein ScalyP_jg1673 [Parmales sp. scaly parma]|nr:hypothetical protein ScalyP_jg1673 [Parmales sp. scaly parma]
MCYHEHEVGASCIQDECCGEYCDSYTCPEGFVPNHSSEGYEENCLEFDGVQWDGCTEEKCCIALRTCNTWEGECGAGSVRRHEEDDYYYCDDGACDEEDCCIVTCADWEGECGAGFHKRPDDDWHSCERIDENDEWVQECDHEQCCGETCGDWTDDMCPHGEYVRKNEWCDVVGECNEERCYSEDNRCDAACNQWESHGCEAFLADKNIETLCDGKIFQWSEECWEVLETVKEVHDECWVCAQCHGCGFGMGDGEGHEFCTDLPLNEPCNVEATCVDGTHCADANSDTERRRMGEKKKSPVLEFELDLEKLKKNLKRGSSWMPKNDRRRLFGDFKKPRGPRCMLN